MSTITRIASVIEGVSSVSARQVRDVVGDLISHEMIRPGRRGHGAEARDAKEGAIILLSSLGTPSGRGAGRLAKRLTELRWKHGTRIDTLRLSERESTAGAVAALERAIAKQEFLDSQTELLADFRQLQSALATLQAEANSMSDTASLGTWHSSLTVEMHIGERVIAEVRARLEGVPTATEIGFNIAPPILFELMAVFADDAPITDPHRGSETRRFDHTVIAALGSALAS